MKLAGRNPIVLFVDAYEDLLQTMESLREYEPNLNLVTAGNINAAKQKFMTNRQCLASVFVDSFIPDFARWAKDRKDEGPPFLLVGVYSNKRDREPMERIGCDLLLCKPFSTDMFFELVIKGDELFKSRF